MTFQPLFKNCQESPGLKQEFEMNKYVLFAIRVVGEVADALEDGKLTQQEVQDFVLMLIKEVPKLISKE